MSEIPALRLRACNDAPVRPERELVLYWMIAARRTRWNHALEHAATLARELGRPLVVLEALRCDYPFASARLHRFVLDGMADNAAALSDGPVTYFPYVEPERGAGKGLLAALGARACAVVTDDFPAFFLPRMLEAAARRLDVRLEAIDTNGLLPLRAADRVFARAVDFRRFVQRNLEQHLGAMPREEPLAGLALPRLAHLPQAIVSRWRPADEALLAGSPEALQRLPIDHHVGPVALRGGARAGAERLERFVRRKLDAYLELRNHPDEDATSGLSPYLHFGHVAAAQVFAAVAERERWSPSRLGGARRGEREGFWGMGEGAQAFLEQLVTWRELGFNMCAHRSDYASYDSLPAWARESLEAHTRDARPHLYTADELERAETDDLVWNAAQNELVREGRVHGYMRMLWGKKVLEWTATPRQALEVLVRMNDEYALDGRDPNSYSGIFWVLGRYDRPWGPERPVFGVVRYMSSKNTARKLRVTEYVRRHTGRGLFEEEDL